MISSTQVLNPLNMGGYLKQSNIWTPVDYNVHSPSIDKQGLIKSVNIVMKISLVLSLTFFGNTIN